MAAISFLWSKAEQKDLADSGTEVPTSFFRFAPNPSRHTGKICGVQRNKFYPVSPFFFNRICFKQPRCKLDGDTGYFPSCYYGKFQYDGA